MEFGDAILHGEVSPSCDIHVIVVWQSCDHLSCDIHVTTMLLNDLYQ